MRERCESRNHLNKNWFKSCWFRWNSWNLMYVDDLVYCFSQRQLQGTVGSVKNSQKNHRSNQHFLSSHGLWWCRCAFKDSKSRLLWIRQTASMPMWGGPYALLSYLRLAMNWVCHGTLLFVPAFPWCSTPLSIFWPVTMGHVALQLLWLATHPWLNTWLCKLFRGASSMFWHLPWLVLFFFVWSNLHYHLVMAHYRSLWRFCPVQWPTFTPISVAAWFGALRFAWYRDLTASAWLPDWIWLLIFVDPFVVFDNFCFRCSGNLVTKSKIRIELISTWYNIYIYSTYIWSAPPLWPATLYNGGAGQADVIVFFHYSKKNTQKKAV